MPRGSNPGREGPGVRGTGVYVSDWKSKEGKASTTIGGEYKDFGEGANKSFIEDDVQILEEQAEKPDEE